MSFSIPISKPKCTCGKTAAVTVYNRKSAPCGTFCKRCGDRLMKELDLREKEYFDAQQKQLEADAIRKIMEE